MLDESHQRAYDDAMEEVGRAWMAFKANASVDATDSTNALKILLRTARHAVLFSRIHYLSKHNNYHVPKEGDILLGIRLAPECSQTVTVCFRLGGQGVSEHVLNPGDARLAYDGATLFSLISLCYTDVTIKVSYAGASVAKVELIYCLLNDSSRRYMASNGHAYVVPPPLEVSLLRRVAYLYGSMWHVLVTQE